MGRGSDYRTGSGKTVQTYFSKMQTFQMTVFNSLSVNCSTEFCAITDGCSVRNDVGNPEMLFLFE